jgi:hypothetical protein
MNMVRVPVNLELNSSAMARALVGLFHTGDLPHEIDDRRSVNTECGPYAGTAIARQLRSRP